MQVLLIYVLGNKNHPKNINDQNFSYFMRGYDKGGLRQRLLRYVVMTYVDSSTNTVSMQWKTAWDSGYIPDMFNNWIQWDSSKYPQWSDVNWVSWNVVDGVPYWKSWKDKYQVNILNKNIWK